MGIASLPGPEVVRCPKPNETQQLARRVVARIQELLMEMEERAIDRASFVYLSHRKACFEGASQSIDLPHLTWQ